MINLQAWKFIILVNTAFYLFILKYIDHDNIAAKRVLLEYNNTKSPIEEAINFLQLHPHMATGQPSNGIFRNKDNKNGLIRDFARPEQVRIYTFVIQTL